MAEPRLPGGTAAPVVPAPVPSGPGSGPVLGIDLGGSTLRSLVMDPSGAVSRTTRVLLPDAPADRVRALVSLAAAHRDEVAAVGVAIAGTVRGGVVTWSANLGVADVDVGSLLGAATGVPVQVLNDARAAGLAEARLGAGRGARAVLVVAVGTGIGGAIVLDGRVLDGTGDAGEIGHMVLDAAGPPCPCGRSGCWEVLVGGRALARAAERVVGPGPGGDVMTRWEARVEDGDPAATEVLTTAAGLFATGVDNLCAVLSPDVLVLAGGVMARGGAVAGAYRAALDGLRWTAGTRVVDAVTGDRAGQLGAALRAADLLPPG
ncbi:ROK family protein [Nakamurella flavida]|uniref:ROK family protein n=1 Tax=Nakamurella flavida TaxID=363630 RepID=A0A939C485_9ACTN|nr:ROK family protein [Nakamurella flavida]MBM9475424.1 ROK family protein [Nakamurella flavida]MBM9475488.1 ROK family protein [Nakamurella flavida]MDP9777004.1 glucokinase [Nakamurella flavida]